MASLARHAKMAAVAVMVGLLGTAPGHARVIGDFDAADANHDGRVTLQEYEAYAINQLMAASGPMARRFQQLTPQQQAARIQQRFVKMDLGSKGYLDRNDWNGS